MVTGTPNDGKRYFYGLTDEKFVKIEPTKIKASALSSFKFRLSSQTEGTADAQEFDKKDVSLVFKYSADNLLNLCLRILDDFPLPDVYKWSIEEICRWLRESGFKQYQNTFRANLITGRSLLLLDASALVAMNIRDFDHIRKITHGIRALFYYEMAKFGRSLSLYPEFHQELYKLVRLKSGAKYNLQRSVVWREMQLIRQKEPNHTHWEILEQWLSYGKQTPSKELIGGAQERIISSRKIVRFEPTAADKKQCEHCLCLPACKCFWSQLDRRPPWHMKCLSHLKPDKSFRQLCSCCDLICNCRWSYKEYQMRNTLTYLKQIIPNKYGRHSRPSQTRRSECSSRISVARETIM